MLIAEITPLFMVKSPFFTSGIPDFQRDNDPKTPRGSCAHLPWSLRSSPESSASPRDQKFRREKPRTEKPSPQKVLQHEGQSIKSAQNMGIVEESQESLFCTCSNQKEKDFPMLLGNLMDLLTSNIPNRFLLANPYLAIGNTVLQPTKLPRFCPGSAEARSSPSHWKLLGPPFSLSPMG